MKHGPKIQTVRRRAQSATGSRGHVIAWAAPEARGDICQVQNGKCKKCDAEVQVITHPAPNEIDVGGSAVVLDCVTKKK